MLAFDALCSASRSSLVILLDRVIEQANATCWASGAANSSTVSARFYLRFSELGTSQIICEQNPDPWFLDEGVSD